MYKIAEFACIKFINNVLIFCSNLKGRLREWKIYQLYLFDAKFMYPCIMGEGGNFNEIKH